MIIIFDDTLYASSQTAFIIIYSKNARKWTPRKVKGKRGGQNESGEAIAGIERAMGEPVNAYNLVGRLFRLC